MMWDWIEIKEEGFVSLVNFLLEITFEIEKWAVLKWWKFISLK